MEGHLEMEGPEGQEGEYPRHTFARIHSSYTQQLPAAAGDPATMVVPLLQQEHIFYRPMDAGISWNRWSDKYVHWYPGLTGFLSYQ